MRVRRTLLGVAGAVAVCGTATAKPPGGPSSEGREVDPVVRDFRLGEPPVEETRRASRGTEKPGDLFGSAMLAELGDAFMRWSTISLGRHQPSDIR